MTALFSQQSPFARAINQETKVIKLPIIHGCNAKSVNNVNLGYLAFSDVNPRGQMKIPTIKKLRKNYRE